jgi:plasmid replication initiation protein
MNESYRLSNELLESSVITKQRMSAVDAKIIRACVSKMQKKYSGLRIQDIESQALEELKDYFSSKGISVEGHFDDFKGEFIFSEKNELRDLALVQRSREILKNTIDTEYEFDVEEISELTAISSNNVAYIRQRLQMMQVKSAYEIKEYSVNSTFSEVEEEFVDVVLIPTIRTRRGKVKFEVNPNAIPYLFALSRNYTKSENLAIARLNSNYAIIFYEQMKKIYKIQKNIRYSFEELQSRFGTRYKRYAEFKKNILSDVIRNVNQNTSMYVELIEDKQGRKVVGIGFSITLDDYDMKTLSREELLARYIVSSKYFSNQNMSIVEYKEEKERVKKLIETGNMPGIEIILPAFEENRKALIAIEKFLQTYQFSDVFEIDWMYLSVKRLHDNSYIAQNAVEAFCILQEQYLPEETGTLQISEKQQTLEIFSEELDLSRYFIEKLKNINPKSEVDENEYATKLKKSVEHYGSETCFQVVDWLFSKQGSFDLQHINSADKLSKKFDTLVHKMHVNRSSERSNAYQGNIFDIYEE